MAISKEEVKILTTKRWRILAVSCLINLCIGSMYAWSVLAAPMAEELQVASLAIVFSIANAVGFITMIIGGLLNDKEKMDYSPIGKKKSEYSMVELLSKTKFRKIYIFITADIRYL